MSREQRIAQERLRVAAEAAFVERRRELADQNAEKQAAVDRAIEAERLAREAGLAEAETSRIRNEARTRSGKPPLW